MQLLTINRIKESNKKHFTIAFSALIGSAFLGLAVPVFGISAGAIAIGIATSMLLVTAYAFLSENTKQQYLLLTLLYGPVLLAIDVKVQGSNFWGIWQIALAMMSLAGIRNFGVAMGKSPLLQVAIVCFLSYIALGAISSLTGRSKLLPGLYQLISDFKPLMVIVLGFSIIWSPKIEAVMRSAVNWIWLPILLLIAIEWLSPQAYGMIFSGGSDYGALAPVVARQFHAVGFFEHPSFLASFAAFFAILAAARAMYERREARASSILSGIYLAITFISLERQEIAACIMAILLMYIISGGKNKLFARLSIAIAAVIVSTTIFWLMHSESMTREATAWGIGARGIIDHPRPQIMVGAWRVASDYFPIGAGLGTYGGAGAAKFDDTLYRDLGFGRYYWFGKESYLTDTYWPNSIAETGFIGAVLLLAYFGLILVYATRRSIEAEGSRKIYWIAAAGALAYMLMLSLTSPSFQDPRLFLLPALLFGIAYSRSAKIEYEKVA